VRRYFVGTNVELVLDVGVAAGLLHAAPEWQLIAGMTMRLGHRF